MHRGRLPAAEYYFAFRLNTGPLYNAAVVAMPSEGELVLLSWKHMFIYPRCRSVLIALDMHNLFNSGSNENTIININVLIIETAN